MIAEFRRTVEVDHEAGPRIIADKKRVIGDQRRLGIRVLRAGARSRRNGRCKQDQQRRERKQARCERIFEQTFAAGHIASRHATSRFSQAPAAKMHFIRVLP